MTCEEYCGEAGKKKMISRAARDEAAQGILSEILFLGFRVWIQSSCLAEQEFKTYSMVFQAKRKEYSPNTLTTP